MGLSRSKAAAAAPPPQTQSKSIPENVKFDDFQILRAIGKGSFGKVCIVLKKDSQRMYAMKYMSKLLCAERNAFENVQREILLLAKLDHPFIVKLWYTFQDEEDVFMVVDLLLGGDLRYHLQQEKSFSEKRVALYLWEIALALDYLRTKNVLHRDIKPDNILLDEKGHVHLTDFNIALELGEGDEANSMSGTKPYMAPEIFECALDLTSGYSFPADWWSLGVCAYEMLCGQRPFDIHSTTPKLEEILVLQQKSDTLAFPEGTSSAFAHLIQRLLSYKRENRICSTSDLKERCSYCNYVNFNEVLEKRVEPEYVPPKDQLNCDPTFELEEMIIETNPLHKKKKRLQKQQTMRRLFEHQKSSSLSDSGGNLEQSPSIKCMDVSWNFITYNRERELEKRKAEEKEKKERIWEEELNKVINST